MKNNRNFEGLTSSRKIEMVAHFKNIVTNHLKEFVAGRAEKMFELKDIAQIISVHPSHLSKVVREVTGNHACHFYEQQILIEAKNLLKDPQLTIKSVAHTLDYDVSNFTKFFKRFTGSTPSAFKKSLT